ncbi:receptor-like cytosolic serine/threonine-protein kinase RBK2 [Chenopodium quinoa]|uniref:non-specific serine/threonine protein kinase n=1 Tax=Chenopodium quinoa TaxID=63459 RepID=A0A803MWV5_CHEQI|nr:receptor-like cytosolic serine/threonine-protein kinase RBK2 [Chenopodium quinoa]XP_021743947.1 receptor-like cytosolic serine/threonine-protein kinase RBK2 [Chenopodium quinoa]XP_021743948.1 receptor-like cytosolic serine/threonine-protein kinase RBK2 [Chenopodium quinoa]
MEKTGQDSNSPVGVLEDYFRSVESDTNSSNDANETQKNPKTGSRFRGFMDLLRSKSKKQLPALGSLNVPKLSGLRSNSMRENSNSSSMFSMSNRCYFGNADSPSRNFTLFELQLATKNFSQENFIGKGGYAEVFKGVLSDGQVVAVKRLARGTPEERIADFLTELGIMAHVSHPNTTKLIGYCVEGGMHLVLEYSHLGSLASLLHGSKGKLNWSARYKIALGIAEGLMYLHYGCQRRIIHRDIKAANILLRKDFEPQICDFGLAKWLPDKWTHHIVLKFEGTFGYLAPEFMMHGIVDEKTDVFAFGVLLLELVTGRRALDCSQQSLVLWAKPLLRKNNIRELIDPALDNRFNSKQMKLMLLAAALCVQRSSIRRPQMNQVLQLLKGNLSSMESMKKYKKSTFWKMYCEEITEA